MFGRGPVAVDVPVCAAAVTANARATQQGEEKRLAARTWEASYFVSKTMTGPQAVRRMFPMA